MLDTKDDNISDPVKNEKREKILKATLYLLAHKGFHGFSIKEVAKNARVATGTVYLYFRDKQDMIEQLHMSIIENVAQAAFENWDDAATPFEKYCLMCRNIWKHACSEPDNLLCKGQFDQLPPDILRDQYSEARVHFERLSSLLELGKRNGEILDLPNDVLYCLTIENFWQIARKQNLGIVDMHEELLTQIIDSTWRGITKKQTAL